MKQVNEPLDWSLSKHRSVSPKTSCFKSYQTEKKKVKREELRPKLKASVIVTSPRMLNLFSTFDQLSTEGAERAGNLWVI